jgi:hypothetical protein
MTDANERKSFLRERYLKAQIIYRVSQKTRKLLKSLIVKIWMPFQTAERNDA